MLYDPSSICIQNKRFTENGISPAVESKLMCMQNKEKRQGEECIYINCC